MTPRPATSRLIQHRGNRTLWRCFVAALLVHAALGAVLAMMPPQRLRMPAEKFPLTVHVPLTARIEPHRTPPPEQPAEFAANHAAAALAPPLVAMAESTPHTLPAGETLAPSLKPLIGLTDYQPAVSLAVAMAGSEPGHGISATGTEPGPYGQPHGTAAALPAAYLQNPPPKYPALARQNGWQGRTVLRVEVLPNGTAGQIEIAESSGYRLLDETSVETVRLWRFRPARRAGRAVSTWVIVPINFRLKTG